MKTEEVIERFDDRHTVDQNADTVTESLEETLRTASLRQQRSHPCTPTTDLSRYTGTL